MSKRLLPLIPSGLVVDQVLPSPDQITILAAPRQGPAQCPTCAQPSERVHSYYRRTLQDLPWQGRPVKLQVRTRRFRCLNPACSRQTFAAPLSGTAQPSARRTERLGDLHYRLGLALGEAGQGSIGESRWKVSGGGEAGMRLAERLAMPVSADTLLRLVCRAGGADPPSVPRVLAVDDWSWRRARRYGTILVDLERNAMVDLLPDRQAESLAQWLRQHPGVEIVARDRAGSYADGVRQGAPGAVQVADRWHLLRNLGDAVRTVVDREHAVVRRIAKRITEHTAVPAIDTATSADDLKLTAAEQRSRDAYARRQARYEEVAKLHAAGTSLKRIAALLGIERKTVRRWLRAGGASVWRMPPRTSALAPYHGHLEQRWAGGCRNAAQRWRELVKRGFSGRPGIVRRWAGRRRKIEPHIIAGPTVAIEVGWQPPSGVGLTRLLMADVSTLSKTETAFVEPLMMDAPALSSAIAAAKRLDKLFRHDSKEALADVLAAAERTPLAGFATSLRRDLDAVQAALDLPWTTSPAEGQINRLKMLKRTMYGRAGFHLLRQRVLHAA